MILEPGPVALEPTTKAGRPGDALLTFTNNPDLQWYGDRLHCTFLKNGRARPTLVFGLAETEALRLRDYLNYVFPPDEPKFRQYINWLFGQEVMP